MIFGRTPTKIHYYFTVMLGRCDETGWECGWQWEDVSRMCWEEDVENTYLIQTWTLDLCLLI